jgi:hypothetical protein
MYALHQEASIWKVSDTENKLFNKLKEPDLSLKMLMVSSGLPLAEALTSSSKVQALLRTLSLTLSTCTPTISRWILWLHS